MRPRCARFTVVLGTLMLGLGAGACTDEVGTSPVAARKLTQAADAPANGKARTHVGRRTTFVIDHDRATVRDEATGHEAKLDAAGLEKVEKGFDRLAAIEAKLNVLRQDPKFEGAMARAAASKRQVRTRLGAPSLTNAALSGGSGGSVGRSVAIGAAGLAPAAARSGDECTELELQIYNTTQEYNDAKDEYERMLYDLLTLGWGFDASGMWTFDPLRYAGQLMGWTLKADLIAYRIVTIRNVLDFLAFRYDLAGCWHRYEGAGGDQSLAQSECHEDYMVIDELKNGVWVVAWEGIVLVCGEES
jgi:hypothetical protein